MEPEKLQLSDLPEFFTPDILSAVLPVSKSTLYRALRQGTIPCLRVGKRFILSRSHLERWLEESLRNKGVYVSWLGE
ncbi:helix-turn-helix domain-containing protein [Pseudoflavonifractor phocaeensis]|uniref:helix-turn-helix domain-containing protein n=1 Tax=Pseudoflavonifractor phocaeensis TaxID=1870988 RepID=UPI00195A191D|nr:helix-turn-helix domain-containing protein [Pseudoflavonifractor phocaeensis]MBM6723799.1 helix-turn-helix domain-containing protein [Pseudoflavonifractor phocaeensis]